MWRESAKRRGRRRKDNVLNKSKAYGYHWVYSEFLKSKNNELTYWTFIITRPFTLPFSITYSDSRNTWLAFKEIFYYIILSRVTFWFTSPVERGCRQRASFVLSLYGTQRNRRQRPHKIFFIDEIFLIDLIIFDRLQRLRPQELRWKDEIWYTYIYIHCSRSQVIFEKRTYHPKFIKI